MILGLKDGIARIVRTFGKKLLAFKLPPRVAQKLQGFLDYCWWKYNLISLINVRESAWLSAKFLRSERRPIEPASRLGGGYVYDVDVSVNNAGSRPRSIWFLVPGFSAYRIVNICPAKPEWQITLSMVYKPRLRLFRNPFNKYYSMYLLKI